MTRKRFVKILMGKGLPRNYANDVAKTLLKYKLPYKCGYCLCGYGFRYQNKRDKYYVKFGIGGSIRVVKCPNIPSYLVPYENLELEIGFDSKDYQVDDELAKQFATEKSSERIKANVQSATGWWMRKPSPPIPCYGAVGAAQPYLKT